MSKVITPVRRRVNRETSEVVLPVLRALDAIGFFVVWTGGQARPASWSDVRAVQRQVPTCPGFVWRQNVGGDRRAVAGRRDRLIRYNLPGMSDIGGIGRNGRTIAIECKTGRGCCTDEQRDYLQAVNWGGGLALVVRSAEDIFAQRAIIIARCMTLDPEPDQASTGSAQDADYETTKARNHADWVRGGGVMRPQGERE